MRKKIKRIVPFVLVGILVSSFVMTNYNKAREAKAAFVVDDIALMIALFAMCGITYTGLEYYHANGQWLDENDSPVADPDTQKQLEGLLDRSKKHWDEEVRKKAIAQGLIDEDGNILNGGSGSTGGDDDDNKFPSWEKLKEKVAKNGGNVVLSVASLLPFVALYGYGALKKSGFDLPNSDSSTFSDIRQNVNDLLINSDIDVNSFSHSIESVLSWNKNNKNANRIYEAYYFNTGYFYKQTSGYIGYVIKPPYVHVVYNTDSTKGDNYAFLQEKTGLNGGTFNLDNYEYLHVNGEIFDSMNDDYLSDSYNPIAIGQDSSLRDAMNESGDYPTSPIHSNVKLPSTDKLKELIKNLKNTADDNDGRQNVVDGFIKDLTTPDDSGGVSPNPNPTPDPSNPDSGGSGGTDTDNPDNTDKSNFTRDLRLVFPFCIPFDLVDCIRLFSAEPETPKIDFPIHFPIVNVDYTFTIDLKDFDGVAKICRSMFLIMFIIGLVFATRPLIRG